MATTAPLADDPTVVQRILDHIDRKTTDLGESTWREPVANYRAEERFHAEQNLLRRRAAAFCPSATLATPGSFVAREAAGTPIFAVRGADGRVRAFKNTCRHRGAQLAEGTGCMRAFACRYHGWTYALDGSLRHVPHEHGFPGLDKSTRGLAPVAAEERAGLVFVGLEAAPPAHELAALPELIPPDYRFSGVSEREIPANWKILVEGFLEGYHIRATHPQTFYPIQYDNLNVVEHFGPNNRIAFPYQAVERQRALAPEARSAEGKLTYVYHLFPNVLVATFPARIILVALEPTAIDRTRMHTFALTNRAESNAGAEAFVQRGTDLVDAGAKEDRDVACAIQRSLASGANDFFEFGLFEGAIAHFHRTLTAALDSHTAAAGG